MHRLNFGITRTPVMFYSGGVSTKLNGLKLMFSWISRNYIVSGFWFHTATSESNGARRWLFAPGTLGCPRANGLQRLRKNHFLA
ncbi:hypothetical protein RHMOL_Rhmol01G0031400 [Rhododendron molle]|uniref:Uncharacterized protein n=1 Tax=Rhododendron molle TaxID=49168 RepID=A0ACC0Q0H3_RHOML|nr:hypothetical protein RHMOL_Rhmol01G0031400 [Rhododendron molle]